MDFARVDAISVLERTPPALDALLRGLSGNWTAGDEGPDTFSARDVVGHLIDGELHDWMPRARTILDRGEGTPFEPFDRFAFRERIEGVATDALLDQFAALRANNLGELRDLQLGPEDLQCTGTHPDFGRVTLEQLLATWVVHDLGHLAQIGRVMAKQVGDAVGPWRAFLPVLDR